MKTGIDKIFGFSNIEFALRAEAFCAIYQYQ